ncbi:MAG: hypothetical protein PW786_15270 [Arachidicoccus sp.]|nr:hypothetical protein [Arachidicoccus sp.]
MLLTKIRKIGNSAGIILSKETLKHLDMQEFVSVDIEKGKIVISPVKRNPRENWEKQLLNAGAKNDSDKMLDNISNQFDQEEWTW